MWHQTIVMSLLLFAACVWQVELCPILPPPDPDIPLPGDPDMAFVTDTCLVALWEETVINFRRDNPRHIPVQALHREPDYLAATKTAETQDYLIAALDIAIKSEAINWHNVQTILILMTGGMDGDERIPELAMRLFQLPRPIKMSDACGWSYQQMLRVLGNQPTEEAANVLYETMQREFWGTDPMHSRVLASERDTSKNIDHLRTIALCTLAGSNVPQEHRRALLLKMKEQYPGPGGTGNTFDEWVPQSLVSILERSDTE